VVYMCFFGPCAGLTGGGPNTPAVGLFTDGHKVLIVSYNTISLRGF
jgi:hypothetical protein